MFPLDWVATLTNLGNTLATLGRLEGDSALLVQAAEAYQRAVQERTRKRVPLERAQTQANLAEVLSLLGRHDQTIQAYRLAFEELSSGRSAGIRESVRNWLVALQRLQAGGKGDRH